MTRPHRGFGEKCHSTVQREAKNGCVINILPKFQVHFFSFFLTEGCLGAAFLSTLARYFLRLFLQLLSYLQNWKMESILATLISYQGHREFMWNHAVLISSFKTDN